MQVTLEKDDELTIRYQGDPLATLQYGGLDKGMGSVEILIDKSVAEILSMAEGGTSSRRYLRPQIITA